MLRSLGVFAMFAVGCSEPAPTASEVRAQVAAEVDVARRLMLLEAHVHRNPDSADAHLWLARAYRDQSDPRAAAEYQRAIALDPRGAIARVEFGYLGIEPDLRRGRVPSPEAVAEARRWVEEALALEPTCERRHDVVGLLDLGGSTPTESDIAWVEAALATCPDERWTRAWTATLGRMHQSAGRNEAAQRELCRSVALGNPGALAGCRALAGADACLQVIEGSNKAKISSGGSQAFSAAVEACGSSTPASRGTLPG